MIRGLALLLGMCRDARVHEDHLTFKSRKVKGEGPMVRVHGQENASIRGGLLFRACMTTPHEQLHGTNTVQGKAQQPNPAFAIAPNDYHFVC